MSKKKTGESKKKVVESTKKAAEGTKELVNVSVLVDESHKDQLAALAGKLKDKGFVLKESLGEIGVLSGSAPAAAVRGLESVPGVSKIEKERTDYRTQD